MVLFKLYSFLTCRPLWTSLGDCHLFFQLCRRSLSQGSWPTLPKPQVLLGCVFLFSHRLITFVI
jgi:hypothetical protein